MDPSNNERKHPGRYDWNDYPVSAAQAAAAATPYRQKEEVNSLRQRTNRAALEIARIASRNSQQEAARPGGAQRIDPAQQDKKQDRVFSFFDEQPVQVQTKIKLFLLQQSQLKDSPISNYLSDLLLLKGPSAVEELEELWKEFSTLQTKGPLFKQLLMKFEEKKFLISLEILLKKIQMIKWYEKNGEGEEWIKIKAGLSSLTTLRLLINFKSIGDLIGIYSPQLRDFISIEIFSLIGGPMVKAFFDQAFSVFQKTCNDNIEKVKKLPIHQKYHVQLTRHIEEYTSIVQQYVNSQPRTIGELQKNVPPEYDKTISTIRKLLDEIDQLFWVCLDCLKFVSFDAKEKHSQHQLELASNISEISTSSSLINSFVLSNLTDKNLSQKKEGPFNIFMALFTQEEIAAIYHLKNLPIEITRYLEIEYLEKLQLQAIQEANEVEISKQDVQAGKDQLILEDQALKKKYDKKKKNQENLYQEKDDLVSESAALERIMTQTYSENDLKLMQQLME